MITRVALTILSLGSTWAQCLAVEGEWVTAGDVSRRIERFAHADPQQRLVRAPFPGARRLIDPSTLPGMQPQPGPDDESSEVTSPDRERPVASTPFCVERRLRTLAHEAYEEAIARALVIANKGEPTGKDESVIGFELVDYERSPLPSGKLEFLVQTLPPPVLGGSGARADDSVLWRGKLLYAEGRSMPVWARVRLWIEDEICVLQRDVARGADLNESDCLIMKKKYPPFAPPPVRDRGALTRTVAARHLTAQEPIYQSLLVRKPDVEAGRLVELKVVNGGAQLRFQAKATASAHVGERVAVTNPSTGKRIEGQVVGPDSVEVHLK
jgi:flagella basal body P-ring formation protein FlgA